MSVCTCEWVVKGGAGGEVRVLRPSKQPKRGCGGRFVEMVIICRIDPAVARAAGTHERSGGRVRKHQQTRTLVDARLRGRNRPFHIDPLHIPLAQVPRTLTHTLHTHKHTHTFPHTQSTLNTLN